MPKGPLVLLRLQRQTRSMWHTNTHTNTLTQARSHTHALILICNPNLLQPLLKYSVGVKDSVGFTLMHNCVLWTCKRGLISLLSTFLCLDYPAVCFVRLSLPTHTHTHTHTQTQTHTDTQTHTHKHTHTHTHTHRRGAWFILELAVYITVCKADVSLANEREPLRLTFSAGELNQLNHGELNQLNPGELNQLNPGELNQLNHR